jgi:hypothetical protein
VSCRGTGVAALGSILASQVHSSVVAHLRDGPLAAHAHQIAQAVSGGRIAGAIHATPAPLRGLAAGAARAGFVDALNSILLIGSVIAVCGALHTVVLIRQRDFVGAAADEEQVTLQSAAVAG